MNNAVTSVELTNAQAVATGNQASLHLKQNSTNVSLLTKIIVWTRVHGFDIHEAVPNFPMIQMQPV